MKKFNLEQHPRIGRLIHGGHNLAHFVYLGLCAVEAHGFYGMAAGVLLVFTLIYTFCGMED